MSIKVFSKNELQKFTANLIRAGKVVGVKKKENKFAFGTLADAGELVLDYDITLRSPRVFFQPPREKILDFKTGPKIELKEHIQSEPVTILGIHTYDLKALNQMDKIWENKNPDEHYLSRRRRATIIAITPTRASKWSFWSSMEASTVDEGFDLLLTHIGGKYAIETGTAKGAKLLSKHAPFAKDATKEDERALSKVRENLKNLCNKDRQIKATTKEISALVAGAYENPIWETQAKKCYSCGSCNLVCPTCYCFDVKDDIELDLATGARTRTWDGCLLEEFAFVGSGENFREHRKDRFRHRILRKSVYVPEKIGELACVGCGRCSEACLPNITDPVYIINKLKEGK